MNLYLGWIHQPMLFHDHIEKHFPSGFEELFFLLWIFYSKKIWKFVKCHLLAGFLIVFDNLLHIQIFRLASWKYFLSTMLHMFSERQKIIKSHKINQLSYRSVHFKLIIWFSLRLSIFFIRDGIKWPINFFYFNFIIIPLEW